MTAPLFHLSPGRLDGLTPGSQIAVDGAEGHHAATVMRLGAGEQVHLSDTQRLRVSGVVLDAGSGELLVEVQEVSEEPQDRPALVLVQGLAKDRRDLQAVEAATELGVDAVIPWQAERSVARWKAGREAKKHAEWVSTVTTAAKQTRRTAVPQVRHLHTTAQYLRSLSEQEGVGVVVLHEVEEISLASVLDQLQAADLQELHLVVGPEGGISETEITQLTQAGARTARLGRSVLRSSTAGPAGIAGAQILLGRWDW